MYKQLEEFGGHRMPLLCPNCNVDSFWELLDQLDTCTRIIVHVADAFEEVSCYTNLTHFEKKSFTAYCVKRFVIVDKACEETFFVDSNILFMMGTWLLWNRATFWGGGLKRASQDNCRLLWPCSYQYFGDHPFCVGVWRWTCSRGKRLVVDNRWKVWVAALWSAYSCASTSHLRSGPLKHSYYFWVFWWGFPFLIMT